MRILVVSARFPELGQKGDQMRALQIARLLAQRHSVTLATAGQASSASGREIAKQFGSLVIGHATPLERACGAVSALLRGLPLQVGWMMPPRWFRRVVQMANDHDVVLAVTIRCLPAPLPVPTVIDHVDALSWNIRQRGELERRLVLRLGAHVEAWLLKRHEQRVARWVSSQAVVSPLDAAELPQSPSPIVMPLALELPEWETPTLRDIDIIFTGDMRYPPNRDAAEWVSYALTPELRLRRPTAHIVLAGRGADLIPRAEGVTVHSDVSDLSALLRRARVAIAPLRRGTGTPIKVLEAAACGAAIVSTPWVAKALDIAIETAVDVDTFVCAIDRLLGNETLRSNQVDAAREGLRRCRPEVIALTLEQLLSQKA